MDPRNQMRVGSVMRRRGRRLLMGGVQQDAPRQHAAAAHPAARQQLLRQRRVRERQRWGYRSWKKKCHLFQATQSSYFLN